LSVWAQPSWPESARRCEPPAPRGTAPLAPLVHAALANLPEVLRGQAAEAVSRKDRSTLAAIGARAALRGRARTTLIEMVDRRGGAGVPRSRQGQRDRAIGGGAQRRQGMR
jgi:hypothetical protein